MDVHWMIHDLQGTLEAAAARRPLALLLDDLQWADSGTIAALGELPERLAGTALLWVLAARTGELEPQARDVLSRLTRDGAHHLRLDALSSEAVVAMIADRTGGRAQAPLVHLAMRTHGNPYLVAELLDGLIEEGRLVVEGGRAMLIGSTLPRRLTDSMVERLERLSKSARQAVRVASVLGGRFSVEHLAAILERPPTELLSDLEEAVRADVLAADHRGMSFRHDILREATAECLTTPVRRALVRQAAAVLLERGAAPVEVARQLADSAQAGDREAVATLRLASRTVALTDAGAAADLSRRALELVAPDDDQRAALVAETIIHLHSADRPDDAVAIGAGALADLLSPLEEAEVRLSLSSMVMRPPMARIEDNRRALELSDVAPRLRARHLSWLAYNLATIDPAEAARIASEALAAAEATGDRQARIMGGLALVSIDCARGRCQRALERIVVLQGIARRAEPEPYLRLIDFFHAGALVELGRVTETLELLEVNVARARNDRNGWLMQTWAQFGSALRYAAGQLADARAEAESSSAAIEQAPDGNHLGATALTVVAQVASHTGDARRLVATADAAGRLCEADSPAIRAMGRWILVLSAVAQERPVEAAALLSDEDPQFTTTILPRDAGHHAIVARTAVAAKDRALAVRAVDEARALERLNPGVRLLEGAALHAQGILEDDGAALSRAAAVLRTAERPLLLAAAAEDAGLCLASRGAAREGVGLLDEALSIFLAAEASADARRVARALRRLGVRRHAPARPRPLNGWGSLTASELRVARLVARGASNRDAAEELFLSPHTVSSHLRSTFAKLGINSRVELARTAVLEEPERPARLGG